MTVTGIISAIVVGFIIGALGRLVVPGKQNIPIWLTIVVGIVAALIGTFLARALGVADTRGFDWIELIIQIVLATAGGRVTVLASSEQLRMKSYLGAACGTSTSCVASRWRIEGIVTGTRSRP